jgi:flagellar hook assembly protein FlgD
LNPAYPNPFNPITTIEYGLPKDSQVSITVYDMLGRIVKELINEKQSAGFHSIKWDASDLSNGLYLVKMAAGKYQKSQKVMLVK